MKKDKIALLDTDFISKAFSSCTSTEHLIDHVLSFPGYRFCCHQQILNELEKHYPGPKEWLREKIHNGIILCYTDETLLEELERTYGPSCCFFYMQFLKDACEAYGKDYFSTHYAELSAYNDTHFEKSIFLNALAQGDQSIGDDHDLGEIKTAVLLQILSNLYGLNIYIFCSDDRRARNGMVQFGDIYCLSILTAFWWLYKNCAFPHERAQPFYDSYVASLKESQSHFRVIEKDPTNRFIKVPCSQILDDVYHDKFEILRNGMLKYIV